MMRAISIVVCLTAALATVWGDTAQGIAAFNAGRYSEALKQLSGATQDDENAHLFLGLTRAALGNCQAALPGLIHRPLTKLGGIAAVECYSNDSESAQEFDLLDELGKQFPNDADVLYLSAKEHMKSFNDATFAMFQRAPSSYRVHELSGEIFEVDNRFEDAAAEYRKAIEMNPSAPDLHFRLGRALLMQSQSPEVLHQAASEFQHELELSPEDAACEFQLGRIAQVETRTSDAKQHFERALKLSPNFVQALLALGRLEKNSPRAIDLLSRAAALEPNNEAAHYALMTAYRNSGEMDKARQEKAALDNLQKPQSEGEFSDFLKRLGEKPTQP